MRLIKHLILALLAFSGAASAAPRGLANNNPGNIIKTSIQWRGEASCKDKKFECFKSSDYGIRAIFKVLINYKTRYGIDTPKGIITRWTSGDKKHIQTNYAKYVSSTCNLGIDESLNTYENLICTVNSIIYFENGYNPLKEEVHNHAFRNNYYASQYGFGGNDKALGSIDRGKEGRKEAQPNASIQTDRGCAGCSADAEQPSTVHSEDYSNNSSTSGSSSSEASSDILYPRYRWLDRMEQWVPIFLGRQERTTMEGGVWSCDNSFRY